MRRAAFRRTRRVDAENECRPRRFAERYSACSIAAGIFATDISDLAT
jgi:hypothetical protein